MDYDPHRIAEILGLPVGATVPRSILVLEDAIRRGFPKSALYNVSRAIEDDPGRANELAYSVVPKSTLNRRDVLTPEQSERTERLARLFAHAEQVFGDRADARTFIHRPHPELDGRSPLEVAAMELGARRVEQVLNALEFGLPV
jgi:putative toxin-antitoxin system antitoxin component (TIGR02293 family)